MILQRDVKVLSLVMIAKLISSQCSWKISYQKDLPLENYKVKLDHAIKINSQHYNYVTNYIYNNSND